MNNIKKIDKIDLSIILPCLNEEKAIRLCLDNISGVIKNYTSATEIIVVDNNSTDKTAFIVKEYQKNNPLLNILLIEEKILGYGSAYLAGFNVAKGKNIFMADADLTYDFKEIPRFIEELNKGYDFVIGNRFSGKIQKKSMPFLHRYIGNPVLSGMMKLFFHSKLKDSHCGMRAIKKIDYDKLNLRTTGMEFASEMIIKSIKHNLKIKELDIEYKTREGESKLKSFTDGWRHLKFMLIYSPIYLFFLPGIILFFIGLISLFWMYFKTLHIGSITLFYHPMFISSLLTIIGYQMIIFAGFAKTYSITHLKEESKFMENLYKHLTLDKGILSGFILILFGLGIYVLIFIIWKNSNFSEFNQIKNSIIALTLISLGTQTIFSSFMMSILEIKEK